MALRTLRCDDCPYNHRYYGDTAFSRARAHAASLGHRVTVEGSGEKDTVYDYRPKGSSAGSDSEE